MSVVECLVTGGTGFLGRRVVSALVQTGREVLLVSHVPVDGYRTTIADITFPDLDLAGMRCSEVYHLAGLAHLVSRNPAARERFFRVNLEGTRNLLKALERTGHVPNVIVLISTVAVYGVDEGVMLTEETPRRATDPYGASKRAAEDVVFEWGARHGVRNTVVRLPLVVGRGAPGNLGAMVRALAQKRYLGVGSGSARRSMVLASDVGEVLPKAAEVGGGVFHLTDGYHPSFAELEAALASAMRRKPPKRLPMWVARLGSWIGDAAQAVTGLNLPLNTRVLNKMAKTLTFSDERARRGLGWNPRRVLDHVSEMVV